MEIIYTRRARNRMRWRKISKTEVETVLNYPDKSEETKNDRLHLYKTIKGRNIRVTIKLENGNLIIISIVNKSD